MLIIQEITENIYTLQSRDGKERRGRETAKRGGVLSRDEEGRRGGMARFAPSEGYIARLIGSRTHSVFDDISDFHGVGEQM